MKKYTVNGTTVVIYDNGKFAIDCGDGKSVFEKTPDSKPNFEINIDGDAMIPLDKSGFSFDGVLFCDNTLVMKYTGRGLEVTVKLEFSCGVVIQTNTAKNIHKETIKLTRFSSGMIDGVAYSKELAWYDKDIKIHICHSKWCGEAQWREYTPTELGMYPTTNHNWEREAYRITAIGAWSTANYYPLVMIEDKTDGKIWFMETEGAHSWQIKLTSFGGYSVPSLSMESTSCDECIGGWYYELHPGEEYTTERSFYGVIDGGFENAVSALNSFKRQDSLVCYKDGFPPLIFNDYMDCVWGYQNPELLIPLIDTAAQVGCEVFCIDGGWYENKIGQGLGDWQPRQDRYYETTLKNLADRMIEKGLIPGIWFEFDACSNNAELFKSDEDAVIRRYGRPVGANGRHFYNFQNKKVCKLLTDRVREFYEMGYRFIKNDFNQNTGIGCTNNYDGNSPAEGLMRNTNAFYEFIDSLYEKFPGLIIENCGSGAMRSDNKTLKHFYLQSSSDQEMYTNNPSIVMGTNALIPSEKIGIWAYPYPTVLGEHIDFKLTDDYIKEMSDGKQTAFNMITGMMGVLYLSGRIDLCDKKNLDIVKKGTELYKSIRSYIAKSTPIYPTGKHVLNSKELASMGLLCDDRLFMAIWNTSEYDNAASIDLSHYAERIELGRVFSHTEPQISCDGTVLKVTLSNKSAVWTELLLRNK